MKTYKVHPVALLRLGKAEESRWVQTDDDMPPGEYVPREVVDQLIAEIEEYFNCPSWTEQCDRDSMIRDTIAKAKGGTT